MKCGRQTGATKGSQDKDLGSRIVTRDSTFQEGGHKLSPGVTRVRLSLHPSTVTSCSGIIVKRGEQEIKVKLWPCPSY